MRLSLSQTLGFLHGFAAFVPRLMTGLAGLFTSGPLLGPPHSDKTTTQERPMPKFAALIAGTAVAFSLLAVSAQAQVAPRLVQTTPQASSGQWYVTPAGCAYSRTQAPGQGVVWMLIRNPHHIGLPPAPRGCATMVRG